MAQSDRFIRRVRTSENKQRYATNINKNATKHHHPLPENKTWTGDTLSPHIDDDLYITFANLRKQRRNLKCAHWATKNPVCRTDDRLTRSKQQNSVGRFIRHCS